MRWPGRYVGLPYGDGPGELRCWGLVRAVYSRELGLELPAYGEVDAASVSGISSCIGVAVGCGTWREVLRAEAEDFDVVVMRGWITGRDGRRTRGVCHVGVLTDPDTVLHLDLPHDAVEVPLSHPTVRHRVVSFQRHKELEL